MAQRLYDLSRWVNLRQSFRSAIYTLNTIPTEPLLHLALYAGLASLKLPSCYEHLDTKNVDCPVCDKALGKLAEEVPFSHHVNSTIVCQITGRIMDGDNMPLAFPKSGNVYSREVSICFLCKGSYGISSDCRFSIALQALEDMATKKDGVVTDPRTGETCEFPHLRKVFIS